MYKVLKQVLKRLNKAIKLRKDNLNIFCKTLTMECIFYYNF